MEEHLLKWKLFYENYPLKVKFLKPHPVRPWSSTKNFYLKMHRV